MTAAPSLPSTFRHRIRIYWEDTDAGGVVFYANYLKFFERARSEWLRTLGIGQRAMHDDDGLVFVVTDTSLRYHRPARLDDEIEVTASLRRPAAAGDARQPRASLALAQAAWRGATLLADSQITLACVDAGTFRPRRIPKTILDAIASLPPTPASR